MSSEEGNRRVQELLAEASRVFLELASVAHVNCIERIEFMGQYVHFGTAFDQDYASDANGRPNYSRKVGGVYVPAVKGPVMNEEYWSASSFDCWPSVGMMEWMFGDDPAKWRRTDYSDDDERWPDGRLPEGSIEIPK